MLRLDVEAVTMEPNGRGAPDASLGGRKRGCQAGTTDHRGRFWQQTDLLALFTDSP